MTNINGKEVTDYEELKNLKITYWELGFEQLAIQDEADMKIKKLQEDAKAIRQVFEKRNKELGANDSLAIYEPELMQKEE